jgi:Domain of unknown function (DUF4396)
MPLLDFDSIPLWLQILGYLYLISGIGGALYITYDKVKKKHFQKMRIMNVVWPVTVFYLAPLGIWAYYHIGHSAVSKSSSNEHHLIKSHSYNDDNKQTRLFWESIFVSVTHCGAGCTIGDVISTWLIFLGSIVIFGSILVTAYILDFTFAWLLGVIFQYLAISEMRKISLKQGLVDSIKADTLSLVAFEIGLFGWMAVVALLIFGTTWHANPTEPIFWFMMQVGMTIGFFTSYPANRWLIEKGIKHGM